MYWMPGLTILSIRFNKTEARITLNGRLVNNLRFADNIGLIIGSGPELQDIKTQFDATNIRFGLIIKAEKIK